MKERFAIGIMGLAIGLGAAEMSRADITWNITYQDLNSGFQDPTVGATRRATVNAVVSYLNTILDADGIVDFRFNQSANSLQTGPLAVSGPAYNNSPNGFQSGHLFQHANTGVDPNGAGVDATSTFDFSYTWNNSTSQPGNGQVDLYSVLLHEITHSLGVLNRINGSGLSATSNSDPGVYTTYEQFLRKGNTNTATPLFAAGGDFVGNVSDLSASQPGIYFWGANAMAANGGNPVRVFTAQPFTNSNLSHYTSSGVMAASIGAGPNNVRRNYSKLDLAVLKDLGWNIKPQGPDFVGPNKFKLYSDNGGVGFSNSLNAPAIDPGRFDGDLAGLAVEEGPGTADFYVEDPATGGAGAGGHDHLTQLNHPEAPGMIALLNDNGSATANGKTWFALKENFRVPIAGDQKMVLQFDVNPNVRGGVHDGTHFDFTFGASQPGAAGGAAGTNGIGLRLIVSGPDAGKFELYDGTDSAAGLTKELTGTMFHDGKNSTDDLYNIKFELIGPRFDEISSTLIRLFIDDQLLHSFSTRGGLGDNFLSFFGGPSATAREGDFALYAVDNLSISTETIPEPAAFAMLLAGATLLRRRTTR